MSATKGWRGNLRIADSEAGLTGASDEGNIDGVETPRARNPLARRARIDQRGEGG